MNSIRILNNDISLKFRLIYFMTYTVQFLRINTFVTWRWPRAGAETCGQFKITPSNKLSCVLTHLKPFPYCTQNTKVFDNLSSGSRVVPWGRTDMTKLTVAFRNFANAPKNVFCFLNRFTRLVENKPDNRQDTAYWSYLGAVVGVQRDTGRHLPKPRPHHTLPLYIYWL